MMKRGENGRSQKRLVKFLLVSIKSCLPPEGQAGLILARDDGS